MTRIAAIPGDAFLLRARPEDLGELPRRIPSEAVHLEESILPVDESQPERQILAVFSPDRRHALPVAIDP